VGVFLRARPQRDRVLAWLIACDLADEERDLPRPNSPLPDLSRELGTGHEAALVRHALLGVALASSDAAGQLSLAVSLPQGPLPLDDRLRLLYPLPSSPVVRESLAATGLPVSLLLAIARNESAFESAARSRAGALGWMQIMPFHYPDRGLPAGRAVWREPRTSVALGARILAGSATRLGGDPYRALAAYNAGDGAVRRWDEQLGGDATRSQFLAWIGYPETRRYVEKVLIDRAIYDWMLERATEPSSGP
jgi:soluble lytic murein transglycosylase-like protein